MWHGIGGPIGAAIQDQVERFNAGQKDIRVDAALHRGYGGTLSDFRAAAAAGDPPEIAVMEVHWVVPLAAGGLTAPLDGLIADDKQFNPDDLFEPMFHGLRWQGKLYGLSVTRSTFVLYFNKQRFKEAGLDPDKPPKTWTEFRAAARKLTPADAAGGQYGFAAQANAWQFESLVYGAGGQLVSKDGKRAEFVVAGAQPIQQWANMIHLDKTARLAGREAFFRGEAAMLIESTALLTSFEGVVTDFEVGTAMVPTVEGQKPGVVMGGGVAVLPATLSPEKQQAAWKFLASMVATEQTAELSRRTGYVPVRKSGVDLLKKEGFYEQRPGFLTAVEQAAYGREIPASPSWPQAMTKINAALKSCLETNEPAGIALTRAAEEVDHLLRRDATGKKSPE